MWVKGLKIHRTTSWLITLFALITILLGYAATRRWFPDYELFLLLHGVTGWILPGLLLVHFIFSIIYLKLKLRKIFKGLRNERISGTSTLRLLQQFTKWGIIVFVILISLSGLTFYPWFVAIFGDFFEFTLHLDLDLILSIFMIVHVGIGARFFLTRNKINHWSVNLSLIFLISTILIMGLIIDLPTGLGEHNVGIGRNFYDYEPTEVETARPDLFQNGSFSVFDVLLHLDSKGEIDLDYHFNASMDTHVIDSLNGETNWWYHTYYSGGGIENNVERIDHYPWKPGTHITMYQESDSYIQNAFSTFREEVDRLNNHFGSVIIPAVYVSGQNFNETFYNVAVLPHNLRNETFQFDVVTAIDVIMTLGDLGDITYELTWHESFRGASYVHSYFVSKINTDEQAGRCGFLYDVSGSYIYLSADERILTSPESISFYWGCL